MKKNVLALSIAAMIGGLGFVGTASADLIPGTGGVTNAEKPVNLMVCGSRVITPAVCL